MQKSLTATNDAIIMGFPLGGQLHTFTAKVRSGSINIRFNPTDEFILYELGDIIEIDAEDTSKDNPNKIQSKQFDYIVPAAVTAIFDFMWTVK